MKLMDIPEDAVSGSVFWNAIKDGAKFGVDKMKSPLRPLPKGSGFLEDFFSTSSHSSRT